MNDNRHQMSPPETSYQVELAVLAADFRHIIEKIAELNDELESIKKDIASIKTMADRWRGATFLILALGSILGWLASAWGNLSKVLR